MVGYLKVIKLFQDQIVESLVVLILITCLLLLNSYHYLNHELYEEYPGNEAVINGFEGTVSIGGTVTYASPESFDIQVTPGSPGRIVKVLSAEHVDSGDRVEVLGLLQRDALTPDQIIVYKKWSYYSIYIRSVFVLPIVLYLFFSYWTFDLQLMRFRRRLDNA
jgi:hypothetical protein